MIKRIGILAFATLTLGFAVEWAATPSRRASSALSVRPRPSSAGR